MVIPRYSIPWSLDNCVYTCMCSLMELLATVIGVAHTRLYENWLDFI